MFREFGIFFLLYMRTHVVYAYGKVNPVLLTILILILVDEQSCTRSVVGKPPCDSIS